MRNYYVKMKDDKRLVILLNEEYSKEELQNSGILKTELWYTGEDDLKKGEILEGQELSFRVQGMGFVSAEPWDGTRRCYNREKVILYSNGTYKIVPTIFSRIRRKLKKIGLN